MINELTDIFLICRCLMKNEPFCKLSEIDKKLNLVTSSSKTMPKLIFKTTLRSSMGRVKVGYDCVF